MRKHTRTLRVVFVIQSGSVNISSACAVIPRVNKVFCYGAKFTRLRRIKRRVVIVCLAGHLVMAAPVVKS